jgi:hypothetical protein
VYGKWRVSHEIAMELFKRGLSGMGRHTLLENVGDIALKRSMTVHPELPRRANTHQTT